MCEDRLVRKQNASVMFDKVPLQLARQGCYNLRTTPAFQDGSLATFVLTWKRRLQRMKSPRPALERGPGRPKERHFYTLIVRAVPRSLPQERTGRCPAN